MAEIIPPTRESFCWSDPLPSPPIISNQRQSVQTQLWDPSLSTPSECPLNEKRERRGKIRGNLFQFTIFMASSHRH